MSNTILGLDLGTNSIGWAVVDKENQKILDTGVRIFPAGLEPDTIGQGDKEKSRNVTRREKRQSRRQYFRKRLRRIKLLEVLIKEGMCPLTLPELNKWKNWNISSKSEGRRFPENKDFNSWLEMNPYELRDKALREDLTLYEFGRLLYQIIHRRGFQSSRKGGEDPKKIFEKGNEDENIMSINETADNLDGTQLGSYLYSILPQHGDKFKITRNEKGKEIRVLGRYTTREMYIEEIEAIWNAQRKNLCLDSRIIQETKRREFKGNINNSRNRNRIQNLKLKYGDDSVVIKAKERGKAIIVTNRSVSLKEFLIGNIETDSMTGKVVRYDSNNSILFWQRPLRSQKSTIANCRFEDMIPVIGKNGRIKLDKNGNEVRRSKKPCPISHPEFELFRALQFVNNIRFGRNQPLSEEQRLVVLDLINKNQSNFNFEKISKALKLTYERFNYESDFKVAGNPTIKQLEPLFSREVWKNSYREIWHCFYFFDDSERLYNKLVKDYNYTDSIEKIEKIKLKEGYSNVSLKAIRNIMPFLEKGYTYDKAVILGGVKNVFGDTWDEIPEMHHEIEKEINSILSRDNRSGEAIGQIKEYLSSSTMFFGFTKDDNRFFRLYHHSQDPAKVDKLLEFVPTVENLRNPIVQQALNETRRLVNSLLIRFRKEYGGDFAFDQIKVEMGRDLKNNKEGRREASFRIRENEEKNDEARQRLAEYGLQPSRTNIQKVLMFREIESKAGRCICPYTGKTVSIGHLLGAGNTIQIEHIIPYSVCLDDSFGNKTICESTFNRLKGEKTPYEFYLSNSDPELWGAGSWEDIEQRAFQVLPYYKAKRFVNRKEFKKEGFIERQLNDSRYIAKKAVEMLSKTCHDVRVMPGQLTAELRHLWGLNNILEPVKPVPISMVDFKDEDSFDGYAIIDTQGEIINIETKINPKPVTQDSEILLPGTLVKNEFSTGHYKFNFSNTELEDGNYWLRLKVNDTINLLPKYIPKPDFSEQSIVFRGSVKAGIFSNDTTGRYRTKVENGIYWAKFEVVNKSFHIPEKGKQPAVKKNQILLYGRVHKGDFISFVYSCKTNLENGKYWIVLDVNPDSIEFIRSENHKPLQNEGEIIITATVDDMGTLFADQDKDFKRFVDLKSGKYFATLEIMGNEHEFFKIENDPPKCTKGQKLLEGKIWVDKYTGEMKFDPKKNRDDHRHHAIDAITIALTEQSYLQRLSTYNAQRKGKQRGQLDSTENYPLPWDQFDSDVVRSVKSILVSYRKDNRVLTKNRKGFSVRGQLHKENVYGKRTAPEQSTGFHRREKISGIKNHKHLQKIVDPGIRSIMLNHLKDNCHIDIDSPKGFKIPADAFIRDGEPLLFLPNRQGGEPVPIKKVRMRESMSNAVNLKTGINQYVNPRKNHHVMLYRDHSGNLQEKAVQFWTVVERKLQGLPVYSMPPDGERIISILEINDMFLLGLSDEDIRNNEGNRSFISKHLYRVQKLSAMYYTFRHHLASTIDKEEQEIRIVSFSAWEKLNPLKMDISFYGEPIIRRYD